MTFRQHDERSIEELRHLRHDKMGYINQARRKIEDLEQLLLSELKEPVEHLDVGWDTSPYSEDIGGTKQNETPTQAGR